MKASFGPLVGDQGYQLLPLFSDKGLYYLIREILRLLPSLKHGNSSLRCPLEEMG